MPRNIILVGFMAAGKSAAGRALANRLGWPLADADAEIERQAGKPIPRIFSEDGEAAFRQLEREVIARLCARAGWIISAGGGAFVQEENRRAMLSGGLVICLGAAAETVARRLGPEGVAARPMLHGPDPVARIRSLLAEREPAYRQAHHTVATDDLTPEQVAERILELLARPEGAAANLR